MTGRSRALTILSLIAAGMAGVGLPCSAEKVVAYALAPTADPRVARNGRQSAASLFQSDYRQPSTWTALDICQEV